MSDLLTELGRSFIRAASRELNLYDRYVRFHRYWRGVNKAGKCVDADELLHHVDNLFMKILENTNQLAVVVSNEVPRYYRNRFTRALNTRDKAFVRWFLRNYVVNYTDVDALVSENYAFLPCFFGYCFNMCPTTGGTCASNAIYTCLSVTMLPNTGLCCTGNWYILGNRYFNMVDNAPWVSKYSTGHFGISTQIPSSPGVFTLTGSLTGPSCFPSNGVTLDLDLVVNNSGGGYNVTCASSCPSGTVCGCAYVPYCPNSNYCVIDVPVLYYSIGLTVLPNTSYSVWWQASVQ